MITNNQDISDEAFTVWCGLRNLMQKNTTEYFISFNMIAYSVFGRIPNRYELAAMKQGYEELKQLEFIKELAEFSKTEHLVDLKKLYFTPDQGYFSDLRAEEMHKIMNIDCRHSKYKLLRYFTCMLGTFNCKKDSVYYKLGSMGLDTFCDLMPISKPTCIAFNEVLEQNELLFIIRHKDFIQSTDEDGCSYLREIPNTYSRWEDQDRAKRYGDTITGYKAYKAEEDYKETANERRSLGQKLKHFLAGKEYDLETVQKLYDYAVKKNVYLEASTETAELIPLDRFDGYDIDKG